MKKLLTVAVLLSLVVFAFGYTARKITQEIKLETLDIMDYVEVMDPQHDSDWHLEVTAGSQTISTDNALVQVLRVCVLPFPPGNFAQVFVDMQGFDEQGPSAGLELTYKLTYLPNEDEETNTFTWSKVLPSGASPVNWISFQAGAELEIPDSIIIGAGSIDTFWLRILSMGLDEPGTLLKDGVEIGTTPYMPASSTDKSDFYGTYTMQEVTGGTWAPAELVIVEETEWLAIDGMADNYQIMQTFEWIKDEPPVYTLLLFTDPDGHIDMPDPSEDPEDLFGIYFPTSDPAGMGHWVEAPLVIDEFFEDWIEDEDGDFYYEFTFHWEGDWYVDHYRVHVTTSDEAARSVIAPDAEYNGTTPYYTDYVLDKEVFYGEWKIENLSECWYPAIIIDEDTVFTEVRAKGGDNKGAIDRYFVYEMVFVRGENQTFTLFAVDDITGDPIEGATVFFNGEVIGVTDDSGAFVRYCPYNYPGAGTWTFEHPDYIGWDPADIESPAGPLTESESHTMRGTPRDHTPVELSAFTATIAGEFVNIAWTSQTETQMMGYRVYRNTTADQNGAMLLDHPMVPATNTSETHTYNVVDNDVTDGTYYYWLEAVEYNTSNFHGPVSVTVIGNVPPVLPEVTSMKNAYPNPFKAGNSTNIEVALKAGETGTLTIYNVMGQVVRTVSLTEGNHTINWNGRDSRGTAVGSGIYFYKLSTPSLNQTKKMVIVK